MEMNNHTNCDTFVAEPDAKATDQLLLTSIQNIATYNTAEPVLLPISKEEIQLAQRDSQLWAESIVVWEVGTTIIFSEGEDPVLLFRIQTGADKLVVPSFLQYRVLCLSHYSKLSSNLRGLRLYLHLRR